MPSQLRHRPKLLNPRQQRRSLQLSRPVRSRARSPLQMPSPLQKPNPMQMPRLLTRPRPLQGPSLPMPLLSRPSLPRVRTRRSLVLLRSPPRLLSQVRHPSLALLRNRAVARRPDPETIPSPQHRACPNRQDAADRNPAIVPAARAARAVLVRARATTRSPTRRGCRSQVRSHLVHPVRKAQQAHVRHHVRAHLARTHR